MTKTQPKRVHEILFEYDGYDEEKYIVGCLCGFKLPYRSSDGDRLVDHLLGAGWDEGYEQANEDEIDSGQRYSTYNPLVIDSFERTPNPYE